MSAESNDPSQGAYAALKRCQTGIGLARIRLGAILCALKDSGAWTHYGSAPSFHRFLINEGVEPKAAYQYMDVAQAFVLDMELPRETLEKMACASMRTLVEAARVVREDNLAEVISIVTTQPRPEAIEDLHKLHSLRFGLVDNGAPKAVRQIVNQVENLTHEQKIEVYQRLRVAVGQ